MCWWLRREQGNIDQNTGRVRTTAQGALTLPPTLGSLRTKVSCSAVPAICRSRVPPPRPPSAASLRAPRPPSVFPFLALSPALYLYRFDCAAAAVCKLSNSLENTAGDAIEDVLATQGKEALTEQERWADSVIARKDAE